MDVKREAGHGVWEARQVSSLAQEVWELSDDETLKPGIYTCIKSPGDRLYCWASEGINSVVSRNDVYIHYGTEDAVLNFQ